ncbi:hypothetical protein ACFXGA_09695 [Actinosynnema sp. NPDC059335]|uniref:hypothetical protein n=1 Tax=Actinosynnema sp. NPDC059335 TaxID=3346804 RepID=UPI00366BF189
MLSVPVGTTDTDLTEDFDRLKPATHGPTGWHTNKDKLRHEIRLTGGTLAKADGLAVTISDVAVNKVPGNSGIRLGYEKGGKRTDCLTIPLPKFPKEFYLRNFRPKYLQVGAGTPAFLQWEVNMSPQLDLQWAGASTPHGTTRLTAKNAKSWTSAPLHDTTTFVLTATYRDSTSHEPLVFNTACTVYVTRPDLEIGGLDVNGPVSAYRRPRLLFDDVELLTENGKQIAHGTIDDTSNIRTSFDDLFGDTGVEHATATDGLLLVQVSGANLSLDVLSPLPRVAGAAVDTSVKPRFKTWKVADGHALTVPIAANSRLTVRAPENLDPKKKGRLTVHWFAQGTTDSLQKHQPLAVPVPAGRRTADKAEVWCVYYLEWPNVWRLYLDKDGAWQPNWTDDTGVAHSSDLSPTPFDQLWPQLPVMVNNRTPIAGFATEKTQSADNWSAYFLFGDGTYLTYAEQSNKGTVTSGKTTELLPWNIGATAVPVTAVTNVYGSAGGADHVLVFSGKDYRSCRIGEKDHSEKSAVSAAAPPIDAAFCGPDGNVRLIGSRKYLTCTPHAENDAITITEGSSGDLPLGKK